VVGEARDEVELMAHEQHGQAIGGEAAEQLEHRHLVADVEKGRRLVEHQRATALGERARQAHALPLTTGELAKRAEVDEGALHRVLRLLAGHGIFEETAPQTFGNSELSHYLRADVPGSLRAAFVFRGSSFFYSPFKEILYSVRTGLSAREKVHGMGGWEFLQRNPEEARIFDEAMTAMSEFVGPAVAAAYDFGAWGSLMDVGGGNGMLLATILRAHPKLRGVLADQPHVIERARDSS